MQEPAGPRRSLGWIHATGIVYGAIVGVGIFLTPGKVAASGGTAGGTLLLWAVGGFIALCGSLCLAEVGSRFPSSGGQILSLQATLGRLPAFLYGWCLLVAIQTGVLVLITFFAAQQLAEFLGAEWGPGTQKLAASVLLLSLMAANLLGVRHGAAVMTTTSLAKLAVLFLLAVLGVAVLLGLENGSGPSPAPATIDPKPWLAGLAATLFSYGGFHQLTWVGGEVRDPRRTVPRAIFLGIGLVIASYLAANLAYLALVPFETVVRSKALAADAVKSVFSDWGGRATALVLCVSAYGVANASLLTAPRVYYTLAEKRLFFPIFGRLHPRTGVPAPAILLQSGLALTLIWLVGPAMEELVTGVVFVDWTFHALTCVGLLLLARREAAVGSARAAWGMPWTALLFVVGTAVGLGATFFDPQVRAASLLGTAVLVLGIPVFYFFRARYRES